MGIAVYQTLSNEFKLVHCVKKTTLCIFCLIELINFDLIYVFTSWLGFLVMCTIILHAVAYRLFWRVAPARRHILWHWCKMQLDRVTSPPSRSRGCFFCAWCMQNIDPAALAERVEILFASEVCAVAQIIDWFMAGEKISREIWGGKERRPTHNGEARRYVPLLSLCISKNTYTPLLRLRLDLLSLLAPARFLCRKDW